MSYKAFKKSNKKSAKEINNKEDILDAIGDLMAYCLGLCEMLEIDSEELLKNIIENNKKEHIQDRYNLLKYYLFKPPKF